jgi:hypothetical protein
MDPTGSLESLSEWVLISFKILSTSLEAWQPIVKILLNKAFLLEHIQIAFYLSRLSTKNIERSIKIVLLNDKM